MARRYDFTGSTLPLVCIAAAYPNLDHFHGVERWVDSEGNTCETVWHFGIFREGDTIEVLHEQGLNADNFIPAEYDSFVGDEWHEIN